MWLGQKLLNSKTNLRPNGRTNIRTLATFSSVMSSFYLKTRFRYQHVRSVPPVDKELTAEMDAGH